MSMPSPFISYPRYTHHYCYHCDDLLGNFNDADIPNQITCGRCNRDNLIQGQYTLAGDDYSPWLDTFDDIAIIDALTPYANRDMIFKELANHKYLKVPYKGINVYRSHRDKLIYIFSKSSADHCYYQILTAWKNRNKEKDYKICKSLINILKKKDYGILKKKYFLSQI